MSVSAIICVVVAFCALVGSFFQLGDTTGIRAEQWRDIALFLILFAVYMESGAGNRAIAKTLRDLAARRKQPADDAKR